MGLSVNKFTYAGDNEFDLNFALGYTSQRDVAAYKLGEPERPLLFEWLTDSRVRLSDFNDLVNGDEIEFRRTVSKQQLPVDLLQPGQATRENLELLSKHIMYALHEVLDGPDAVTSIISLTQSEYDAIGTPNAATIYIITDA